MTLLGASTYYCHVCEKQTNHKLFEAKSEGNTFVLKLCTDCLKRKQYEQALQEVEP